MPKRDNSDNNNRINFPGDNYINYFKYIPDFFSRLWLKAVETITQETGINGPHNVLLGSKMTLWVNLGNKMKQKGNCLFRLIL